MTVRSLDGDSEIDPRNHFSHGSGYLIRHGGNIPALWARSNGARTRLIGMTWVDEYQAIVALGSSGFSQADDLRGCRIGIPRREREPIDYWRAMCLRGVSSALSQVGLDRSDVELVDIPSTLTYLSQGDQTGSKQEAPHGSLWAGRSWEARQRPEAFALIRGEVDAIYTSGAAGARLSAFLDATVLVDIGNDPETARRTNNVTPALITASEDLATDHPEFLASYLAELRATAAWAQQHEEAALRIIAGEVGASESWCLESYGQTWSSQLAPDLRQEWLDALESQKEFLIAEGFLSRDFSIADWLLPGLLDSVTSVAGSPGQETGA